MLDHESTSVPVRVSIPASVAADIGSFRKSVTSILDKLGCGACCSGHDLYFELQRDIMLPEKLSARAELAPMVKMTKTAPTTVAGLHPELGAKIDDVFSAIDRIAELTGCNACCSGHDLWLRMERNMVLDAKLNLRETVLRVG